MANFRFIHAGSPYCDQAAIGDGDAMRVARKLRKNGLRSAERLLRIDHPFRSPEPGEEGGERVGVSERCLRAKELESAGLVGRDQHLQDQASEQP